MDAVRNATGSGTETRQVLSAVRTRLVRPEQVGGVQREGHADGNGDVDSVSVQRAQAAVQVAAGTLTPAVSGTSDGGAVESTRAADDAARESFFRMLINNGICPVQLYEDLLVSLMDSGNEEYDRSKVFGGVGPGLTVDATA